MIRIASRRGQELKYNGIRNTCSFTYMCMNVLNVMLSIGRHISEMCARDLSIFISIKL